MKKPLIKIGTTIALVLGVTVAMLWMFRIDLLLWYTSYQADAEYANLKPHQAVPWQSGPDSSAIPAAERPPNIILIVADDLGYNDISTFGGGVADGKVKTPNIDRLAADGAIFTQSYSGANTCAPSRAMLMTGRYPSRTGFASTPTPDGMGLLVGSLMAQLPNNLPDVVINQHESASKPPYEEQGLPTAEKTLAELLGEQGYYTAHIGKWHLGRSQGMTPNDQGFDDSLLMHSGLYLPEDDPNVVNAKLAFDPIDIFLWARLKYAASFNSTDLQSSFTPGGYLTDYYTDESIRVIQANQHRPFFLYLAHWGVHTPLQATKADYEAVGDIEPHRLRVYAAMIRALDRSVGEIDQALQDLGLADNTLIVFTSDNGGAGYLGLDDVNTPFRGWKITSFEGGVRVPLFMKWPAKIKAGTRADSPVAHIDMLPSLVDAAQFSVPDTLELDGKNVLPLTQESSLSDWPQRPLFWVNDHSQTVRFGDWKLQINDLKSGGIKTWLFDLSSDPSERHNLALQRPDKVTELGKLLTRYRENSRPPLYPATASIPVMIDKTLAEKFVEGDEYVLSPN